MEKRRNFILVTILLLVVFTVLNFAISTSDGWRLSNGIVYLVYSNQGWYGIVGIVLSGVSILVSLVGTGLGLLLILITFVLFFLSGKKPKLALPTYIALAAATLITLGTFVCLHLLEIGFNVIDIVLGTGVGRIYFYGYIKNNKIESISIEDTVKGGISIYLNLLHIALAIIPLVTFVLSIALGRKRKKKEEQIEEQLVEQQQE